MRNVKSIVTAALALTVICAVVVAALAGTHLLTKEMVAEQMLAATNAACAEVLPADDYVPVEGEHPEGVLELYAAVGGGETVGYIVKTDTNGKGGGLIVMTGVTADGTVAGVKVIENNETAGYIEKVTKGGLFDGLLGVSSTQDVAAVSQATKTSEGIKAGVALALSAVQEVTANG